MHEAAAFFTAAELLRDDAVIAIGFDESFGIFDGYVVTRTIRRDIDQFLPIGTDVERASVLDPIGNVGSGWESEGQRLGIAQRGGDTLDPEAAGRVVGISAGQEFLEVGHAVAISVLRGIGGIVFIETVEVFPSVGHAVTVSISSDGIVGAWRRLCGAPIDRVVSER